MTKATLVFLSFSLVSVGALAATEGKTDPGDPQKPEKQHQSFGLSEGYFSFFSLFVNKSEQPDSTKFVVPIPKVKEDTRKPK